MLVVVAALSVSMSKEPVFIDLSQDDKRQVVVDREPGRYLGHVTTTLFSDGKTILCTYPQGHGKGAIVMKRSTDEGRSWSQRLPLPASFESSLEVPTLFAVERPLTGEKRLLLWSGLYPARLSRSDDFGRTWSELKAVGDWGGIVVMGSLTQLPSGKLLAWFHDDGRFFEQNGHVASEFNLYQTSSLDAGETWEHPHSIWHGADIHLCEPGLVRSPDGRTLALLLRENKRVKNSFVTFSRDEGQTWTKPVELPSSLTGDRHTCAALPDGRLVICFRDMAKNSPTKGDFVAWVGTFKDILVQKPGQYRVRLLDNLDSWDCGYPGVEVLPSGTIVATTYGHWTKGDEPYIKSVRFRVEELDAIASGSMRD